MVFLGGIGRCSNDQRPQEAPAEALAPGPAPMEASALAPAPVEVPAPALAEAPGPAKTPAEAPAEALAPEETPAETPVEAPPPVEAPVQAELPAQYPSEHLIQSASEENQIPSHLPACPSLQHIASLRGSTIVEFFHSSIAEVLPGHWSRWLALGWRRVARSVLGAVAGLTWGQPQVLGLHCAGFSPSFHCPQC